jgi:hypothetical protein
MASVWRVRFAFWPAHIGVRSGSLARSAGTERFFMRARWSG